LGIVNIHFISSTLRALSEGAVCGEKYSLEFEGADFVSLWDDFFSSAIRLPAQRVLEPQQSLITSCDLSNVSAYDFRLDDNELLDEFDGNRF
jgi:hypothetical protein